MSKVNKFRDRKVKGKLFNDDSEEEENDKGGFKINKDYAAKYEQWRSKEELQKLKDRYGENAAEEDDSSSSEDSGDETPPNVFGKDFLHTLSLLKSKDPKVYDKDYKFFAEEDKETVAKNNGDQKKSRKPLFLKDYERETLLRYNGEIPDEERENEELKRKLESKSYSFYEEEQKKLKESFKKNLDSDSEDGDMFTHRVKTKEELKTEEEDFVEWLKGQKDEMNEDQEKAKEMKYLRDYWNDPKLEAGEAFLRNYILEKKYLDGKEEHPTYDEIVEESEEEEEGDQKFNDVQEIFEHKYNFRFEEPDEEFIKKYPRTMKESMRRKDTKRKDKRLEIRDRKKREKEQKKQDLKRLKALKRKEIMEKISKIKEITGNTSVGFEGMDLEGDFNAEEHDAKMQAVFGDEYYGNEEEGDEEAEKPAFPPLDEGDEGDQLEPDEFHDWDDWEPVQGEPECEDPNFNMDCDYDPQAASTSSKRPKKMSKKEKKRQSKLYKALNKKKPLFNPDDKTFEEYFDEYYKLDYEDIIDDLPCRFKYRKVIPNDFGLDVEEILTADDKELNKWSSLKKTCQVRTEDEERYDVKAYAKKANNWEKKKKILKSVYPDEEVEEQLTETSNETKKKKKANKSDDKEMENDVEVPAPPTETPSANSNNKKKKKRKKNKKKRVSNGTETAGEGVKMGDVKAEVVNSVSKGQRFRNQPQKAKKRVAEEAFTDDRLKAYGINPKKYRNRLKYAPKQE